MDYTRSKDKGLSSYLALFDPKYRRPVLIMVSLMIFRQLTGIYAILSFQTDIFRDAGSSVAPRLATIYVGSIQLLAMILASLLSDKVGRKKLIVFATLVMALAAATFGLYRYSQEHEVSSINDMNWLPVVCLFLFCGSFSIGIGPSTYALMAEILPAQIKNQASATASALNSTVGFLTIFLYHPMENGLTKAGIFWFYSCVCLAISAICQISVKETKGRTLADIESSLTKTRLDKIEDNSEEWYPDRL